MQRGQWPLSKDELYDLYVTQLLTLQQIASRIPCARRAVRLRLQQFGIPIRSRSQTAQIRWAERKNRPPSRCESLLSEDSLWHFYCDEGLSATKIAKRLQCNTSTVCKYMRKYGINIRKSAYRTLSSGGYVLLYIPGHHLAAKDGYLCEHRLVWEETTGQLLPDGWVVHHIDGDKTNNHPQNLVAISREEHWRVLPDMAHKMMQLRKQLLSLTKENELHRLVECAYELGLVA